MRVGGFDIRCCALLAFLLLIPQESLAKKKDYKGLFGSYRRDKFVENEARDTDFGINILLSTLLPMGSIVTSQGSSLPSASLHFAAFYNIELEAAVSFKYHWQVFTRLGYHTFSTEREQTIGSNVRFHKHSIRAYPVLGGIKYRFRRDDVVPYVGVAAGISFVERQAEYDFNPTATDLDVSRPLTVEMMAGVEFYFGARAGLRLEIAGYYMKLEQRVYDPNASSLPVFTYKANPVFMRYASGLFILF